MGIITKIEVQKKDKNRSNLYIDGEFFSGIQNEVVIQNNLKINQEINEHQLLELIYKSDKIVAFNKALSLLNTRFKTRQEIRNYLLEKGFNEEVVIETLEKLVEYKYINDEHYVEAYINSNKDKKSKKVMELELLQKGVNQKIIEEKFIDLENETDLIFNLYTKYMKNKENSFKNRQKAINYLIGKGFKYDDINTAINFTEYE